MFHRYFGNLPLGTRFYRGESLFKKVNATQAHCLESGHCGDNVGQDYEFGSMVVVRALLSLDPVS